VGAWGLSGKYMNFGELRHTDSSGLDMGPFTPYDMALTVGLACYVTGFNKDPEDRFVLGATGKFVRSKIISADSTLSADIGLLTPLMLEKTFRMALTAQNIMGTLRFDKEETTLPLILRLGSLISISRYLNITADIIAARDYLPYLAVGSEARVRAYEDMDLFLRAGFNTRAVNDISGARNATFGAGLRYRDYRLDYAFSPFGAIGSAHRISISMIFSNVRNER